MDKMRVAFIGLGGMGIGMASRLTESGFPVAVYNRTRAKSEQVGALGARVADSPADAAHSADVVLISLANQHVVDQMLVGTDGVFGALGQGGYVVDMSTVAPDFARDLASRAAERGYRSLDACVLGNPFHARSGELRVMVGGAEGDFETLRPVFETIGKALTYLGTNGMGATMKLVLNMLMGVQMPALAEAVVLGEKAGLPRDTVLQLISESGYSSPTMSMRCGIMQRRQYDFAAFKLGLMRKDMMLVLAEADRYGVPMPVSAAACASLTAAGQQGLADLDVAAMLPFQEHMAGMHDEPLPGSGTADPG